MRNKIFGLVAIALMNLQSTPLAIAGGGEVNNGGGIAERMSLTPTEI